MYGRGRLEKMEEIKHEVKGHFYERFQEPKSRRPKLKGVDFNQLSMEDKILLEEPFSFNEIK